jgi:phosphonate transport system substrate-binding protein
MKKPMLKLGLFVLIVGLASLMMGMGSKPQGTTGWPEVIRMGLIPTESATEITARWQPLLDHINKNLGVKVKAYNASDYAAIIEAMRFKKIEAAYFGPKSYVSAHERAGAEAVAREQAKDGSTGYHGIIITKKGSGLKTVSDIRGMTWAFNDPQSTSGYLVPMTFFLTELKTKPEDYFSKVMFSGSHEASMMAVKVGNVNAASTNDLDLQRAIESGHIKKDDFNIIWTSKIIPGSPICVRGDLPESFKKAFKQAVLSFNDSGALDKLQLKGFVDTTDADYDSIRRMNEVKNKLMAK